MSRKFHKILIANRGEVALRVIRACRALGLPSIVAFSTADRNSLPVRIADEAICIGDAPASESYLKFDRVISAAELSGATAIHPGYGFLSENANFARICGECGITFIGPSPEAIAALGDKAVARKLMQEAGVPVVPGSAGVVDNVTDALENGASIGYPVIVKASAGGGGKGMRVAMNAAELPAAFATASAEAAKGFGNSQVYMERYLLNPRHVEVQFVADGFGNVVTLGERDCSMQRNHQKVVEESPCPVLSAEVRRQMCAAAVRAAKSVRYVGVGTVEFLYVPETSEFFFMEINTRLQVEHPVTEMICGIDLVATQISVALGERLPWRSAPKPKGHAMEIRINAEDPRRGFAPCPGKVEFCQLPGGPGVRVDSHLYSGYVVPPYYDSMIAKIIVHGDTRENMYRRAMSALSEVRISGITTNVEFVREVLESNAFFSGDYNTGTLTGMLGQS